MEEEWIIAALRLPKEIKMFIENTFLVYEIRGRVGIENGVKFFIHTNERNHALPHVHAEYGEYEISISLEDNPRVLCGNLPKKQQLVAVAWVSENKSKLLSDWSNIAISAISHTSDTRLKWSKERG